MNIKNRKIPIDVHGYTLVELMVAVALSLIVSGMIYKSFVAFATVFEAQEMQAELHQNIRIGINRLSSELRLAGYDPLNRAGAGFADGFSNQSVRFSMDGNGDGSIGIDETLTYRYDAANKQLDRRVDNGQYRAMVDSVSALEFRYFQADGSVAAEADDIRIIQISMVVESANEDFGITDRRVYANEQGVVLEAQHDHRHRRMLVTSVGCRNMGL